MDTGNLQNRLVRYVDLVPCLNAFIDTRSPGSDKKENFTIIGPGVAENPDQYVHIRIPHGFNIGGARQPPACLNSQHSHLTEEVFLVHSGNWAFRSGVNADDGEIILHPGDVITLPTDIFRGFENLGPDEGYLFAVLGGDDPGRVLWAPRVFDLASKYGLVLLEDGSLVDTNLGQRVPDDVKPMPRTSDAQIAEHRVVTSDQMNDIVIRKADYPWSKNSTLASFSGVEEAALLGPANPAENTAAGTCSWDHGFVFRAIRMQPGAQIPSHRRSEEEVIFVLAGQLSIEVENQPIIVARGDTFTTPIGSKRSFSNTGDTECICYITRRGNQPAAPQFE
jgi:quercetin dioxygenase-like cupin family protein